MHTILLAITLLLTVSYFFLTYFNKGCKVVRDDEKTDNYKKKRNLCAVSASIHLLLFILVIVAFHMEYTMDKNSGKFIRLDGDPLNNKDHVFYLRALAFFMIFTTSLKLLFIALPKTMCIIYETILTIIFFTAPEARPAGLGCPKGSAV